MFKKSCLLFIKQNQALLYLTILCFCFLNGSFGTPDEARYVEIAREMVFTNNWLTPRLNGVKYFEKPPLMYWIHACLISIFGTKEWIMRLVPAFFGWIGIISTFFFARYLFNRKIGILSAIVLGTSVLYQALSRIIILDMPFSIFMTLAIMTGYIAIEKRTRTWFFLCTICLSLAVMTKGVIGLMPGLVLLIWMLINYYPIRPFYPFSCLVLFLIIILPWHIWVSIENPEFLHKYFYIEHFIRYTTTFHARHQPVWFFIPIIFLGMMPWTFFLFKSFQKTEPFRFLWIWFLVYFIFFSFSNSKLIPYILPVFPALSILVAKYIYDKAIKVFPFILISILLLSLSYLLREDIQKQSMKEFALYIKQHKKPNDKIVSFKAYYQDLPVYLNETITIVGYKGELEFGTEIEDTTKWMVKSLSNMKNIWIIAEKNRWIQSKEKGKIIKEIRNNYPFDNACNNLSKTYYLIYR